MAITKEQVLDFLRAHKDEMEARFGVTRIGLFGSYVRGEVSEDSDIDIAVEMRDERIFRNFFELERFLKNGLKKEVDIGIESTLKPVVKKRVAKEIIYV